MEIYPYQMAGARWLASRERALLADEPGLGKTCQALIACDLVRASTILVIPPATVRFVWREEVEKWSMFGHRVHVMTESTDRPRVGWLNIINYDLLVRGFNKKDYGYNALMLAFLAIQWDVVICDESHYLKEPTSLRTKAVLRGIEKGKPAGLNAVAKRLWLMSGTPMPNHPGELWTTLVATGAIEMEYAEFIDRYCLVGTGYDANKPRAAKPEMLDELNKILARVMMRRYKQFVMPQLPSIRIDDYPVPSIKLKIEDFFAEALGDKKTTQKKIADQEAFVQSVWQAAIASEGRMDMMAMVRILEDVGPAVSLYRRWLGAMKAAAMTPIIQEELETGALKKVVIFAHHSQVIAYLRIKLKDYNPCVIEGSVGQAAREKAVHRFQNDPNARVFIGQTHAAGTGITLTASHEVIVLEPDWTPANNAQAIMRCHRIGQKSAVRVRFVRLVDTLDDYISEVLARKTREIARILGD